jgi:hypothetical protein
MPAEAPVTNAVLVIICLLQIRGSSLYKSGVWSMVNEVQTC